MFRFMATKMPINIALIWSLNYSFVCHEHNNYAFAVVCVDSNPNQTHRRNSWLIYMQKLSSRRLHNKTVHKRKTGNGTPWAVYILIACKSPNIILLVINHDEHKCVSVGAQSCLLIFSWTTHHAVAYLLSVSYNWLTL